MKKLMLLIIPVTLFLCVLGIGASAQDATPVEAPPFGVVMAGNFWADDAFENYGGGFQIGTKVAIDSDKGLYTQTLLSKVSLEHGEDLTRAGAYLVEQWSLGRGNWFYLLFGGEVNLDSDPNTGTDLATGLGYIKRIKTFSGEGYTSPPSLDLFLQTNFVDNTGGTNGYAELTFGITFGPGQKL